MSEAWRSELEELVAEWEADGRPTRNDHAHAARLLGLCRNFESGIARWEETKNEWSPMAIAKRAFLTPASPGEQIQAAFVLKVWNTGFPCPTADVLEIAARLDRTSRQTIANWIAEPWFP